MCQARVVEHVYAQLWPEHGKPTHPEDVENLRDMIRDIVAHTVAYLDNHPGRVDWTEPPAQAGN